MSAGLRNWEIVVYALYLKGGSLNAIHTEDIALKCHEMASDSFSWTKYPQYPDKDIVRVALTDARKQRLGALVTGRSGRGKGQSGKANADPSLDGWRLTPGGMKWIRENEGRLASVLGRDVPKAHRVEVLRKLARIRGSGLFQNYLDNPHGFTPDIGALAELLRCRVDAEDRVWLNRFETLRNQAELAGQEDVLDFVGRCQGLLPALK